MNAVGEAAPKPWPERIRREMPSLPRVQIRVARLVAAHPEEVVFLSVEDLARKAGSSPATVVRLARGLGYGTYGEMRRDIADWLRMRMNALQRVEEGRAAGSLREAFLNSIDQDARLLGETSRNLAVAPLERAADLVWSARQVRVAGERGLGGAADLLVFGLGLLRNGASLLQLSALQAESLATLGPEDVVVAFCFPRYTRSLVEGVRLACAAGAKLVLIADGPNCPAAREADVLLTVPDDNPGLPLSSTVPATAVANALIAVLARWHPEARRHLAAIEQAHRRLRTWWAEDPS